MFKPSFGPWSVQDFSELEGLTLGSHQTITGGVLSLLPFEKSTVSFTRRWDNVTGWSFNNNLNSQTIIENSFSVISGVALSGHSLNRENIGYNRNVVSAGAWNIRTELPVFSGGQYTGQEARYLRLSRYSPYDDWYYHFISGGTEATLEVDLASVYDIYSGSSTIGFTTGQNLLTSLPSLSGVIGQGIYIDNGTNWDFIEVNPFGLRSVNHPEVAINIDLNQPKRVRIGISNNNIYLATEDGRGVAGISKFNTAVHSGNDAKILFGAPELTGRNNQYPFLINSISGFAGETLWDNVKILLGKNVITETTGSIYYYTTSIQTGYTDYFDPSINISRWNTAIIEHSSNRGGATNVAAQYSGTNGWTTFSSINLTGQQSPSSISLYSMPVFASSRSGVSHNKISNPVRFKIEQASNGFSQPPSIDSISVSASTEDALLDILPNWKPVNQSVLARFAVESGLFLDPEIKADQFTTFLLNTPQTLGDISGAARLYDKSIFYNSVAPVGKLSIDNGGWSSYFIRNMQYISGAAIPDSEAASYFGTSNVYNFFPNPMLEDGFYSITGDPAYVHNVSFGDIAIGCRMVPSYTGRASIIYSAQEIYRPENAAKEQNINTLLGRSSLPSTHYVQSVVVPQNSFNGTFDSSCGIETIIPSGIASGNLLFSVDLQIPAGTGIQIYAFGSVMGSPRWNLEGASYRSYRNISLPLVGYTGQIIVGFIVPSGTSSSTFTSFNIDNIEVSPYSAGYLIGTGIQSTSYSAGINRDYLSESNNLNTETASTVVGLNARLLAYPTGDNNSIVRKIRTSDSKGFEIYITPNGYLAAEFDVEAKSRTTGLASGPLVTDSYLTGFVSDYKVPLGEWIKIGFVHQNNTYQKCGFASYSGQQEIRNFASSNRAYLLANGYPVGVLDLMRNWNSTQPTPTSPRSAMIADGTGTLYIASGVHIDFDAVKISRPIVANAEVDISLRQSKVTLPYFVPEVYFKPGADESIVNTLSNSTGRMGKDFYIGSIYNFDNPGYTNWDHGPWGNHLIFYGNVAKSNLNPYSVSGLGSTYMPSGSFGLARYSSATERQINTLENLNLTGNENNLGIESGQFKFGGWVYPHTSGQEFFHIHKDVYNNTGDAVSLGFTNDMKIKLSRKSNATNIVWSMTGSYSHLVSGWNWIEVIASLGNFTGNGQAGRVAATAYSLSGTEFSNVSTGLNYGFQYMGRSGSAFESAIYFGRTAEVSLNDWFICPVYSGSTEKISSPLEDKSGRYQVLLKDNIVEPVQPEWESFWVMNKVLSGNSTAGDSFYSLSAHNNYDNFSRMNGGINLYDNSPFKNTESYYLEYNISPIESVIGSNKSPIRIGNIVPEGGVNLARISSPKFSVDSTVSIIDLSYTNQNNLSSYRDGTYPITREQGTVTSYTATGSFNGINHSLYTGRLTASMSGQAHSKNILVSSYVIPSIKSTTSYEGFYCYLVGRGQYAVKVNDYYPHSTGELTQFSTGQAANEYFANLGKLESAIQIKDSDGNIIPFDTFPYSIIPSPHTPSSLSQNIDNGISVNINGIGSFTGSNYLEDGVFSVVLVTNKAVVDSSTSAWIHYPSYDLNTSEVDLSHKEIINPIPIMRQSVSSTDQLPGRYSFDLDANTLLYSVNIIGINSGYTNKL